MSNLFVVLTVVTLIALTVSERLETRKRGRIKKCVIEKTNGVLEKHFKVLSEKRFQQTREKWSEEIRYFVLDHVRPVLSREELRFLHENFAAVALAVERTVEAVMGHQIAADLPADIAPRRPKVPTTAFLESGIGP